MHSSRKQEITPEVPLKFTDAVPLALWQCSLHIVPAADEGARRDLSLKLVPIRGAFVAAIPVSTDKASILPDRAKVVYGRTNEAGWIVKRALDELGEEDDVPKAPAVVLPAPVFWF